MEIRGIKIEFLGHDGFLIEDSNGKKIAIDPFNISNSVPQVDLILITHSHYDHCSIKDIQKIAREGTTIFVPADAQSKITHIDKVNMQIIAVGDEISVGNLKIEAVPAYNPKKQFHPKQEGWLGFLIKMNNVIIYHAGDTDKIPEMEKLTGYAKHGNDLIAILPVSGTYVMDAEEAAEVAKMIKPTLAIPMHYGAGVVGTANDAQKFVDLCTKAGIKAQILEKI